MEQPRRCPWAGTDPRMIAYNDRESGVPAHDDGLVFEFLTLEGAQAGLSWQTIFNTRDAYREAFAGFDPAWVASCNRCPFLSGSSARKRQLRPFCLGCMRRIAEGESLALGAHAGV